MTHTELKANFDKLIKVAGIMLKTAQDGEATPQDAIQVLDTVVDELTELRQAIPGGSDGTNEDEDETEDKQVPPGQKQEPAEKGAALEKDTVEEGSEKVNEENAAQKALQTKTYTMNAKEVDELKNENKALKARLDELEQFKQQSEIEAVAEEYSDLFPPHQRKAKYEEVIKSDRPIEFWQTSIDAISEFHGTVKPAKTESHWLPQKNAKQTQTRLRTL